MAAIVGLSMACLSLACSDDDDSAPRTAPTGSVPVLDASVRDLPGDGVDPTPEFDIDARQREPIGPERLNDEIDDIQDYLNGSGGQSSSAPDAATDGAVDAGTD
jgi:hypothetical protein